MEIVEAQEFLKNNHRGVLVARKSDRPLLFHTGEIG
jgi:hypothetical protein